MANPLGTVFSRADALKRQLYDMLSNPRDYASMVAGRTQEAAQAADALQKMAFADPQNPLKITNPQALNQLTQMITSGPLGFAPAGITAFHGSPYLFRQFDPMKVGTGEGAQAYGVGAGYTAEARPVAEEYKRQLGTKFSADNKLFYSGSTGKKVGSTGNTDADDYLLANLGNIDKAIVNAKQDMKEVVSYNPAEKTAYEKTISFLENLKSRGAVKQESAGYLYKGDIPDEILPKFLDWDKPLSQQSDEVKTALEKAGIVNFEQNIGPSSVGEVRNLGFRNVGTLTGEELYKRLTEKNFAQKTQVTSGARKEAELDASNFLENIGVRGIRYLDQGSRGKGKGTSNFVPFRSEDFKIQEINDIPIEDYIAKGLL